MARVISWARAYLTSARSNSLEWDAQCFAPLRREDPHLKNKRKDERGREQERQEAENLEDLF